MSFRVTTFPPFSPNFSRPSHVLRQKLQTLTKIKTFRETFQPNLFLSYYFNSKIANLISPSIWKCAEKINRNMIKFPTWIFPPFPASCVICKLAIKEFFLLVSPEFHQDIHLICLLPILLNPLEESIDQECIFRRKSVGLGDEKHENSLLIAWKCDFFPYNKKVQGSEALQQFRGSLQLFMVKKNI